MLQEATRQIRSHYDFYEMTLQVFFRFFLGNPTFLLCPCSLIQISLKSIWCPDNQIFWCFFPEISFLQYHHFCHQFWNNLQPFRWRPLWMKCRGVRGAKLLTNSHKIWCNARIPVTKHDTNRHKLLLLKVSKLSLEKFLLNDILFIQSNKYMCLKFVWYSWLIGKRKAASFQKLWKDFKCEKH